MQARRPTPKTARGSAWLAGRYFAEGLPNLYAKRPFHRACGSGWAAFHHVVVLAPFDIGHLLLRVRFAIAAEEASQPLMEWPELTASSSGSAFIRCLSCSSARIEPVGITSRGRPRPSRRG